MGGSVRREAARPGAGATPGHLRRAGLLAGVLAAAVPLACRAPDSSVSASAEVPAPPAADAPSELVGATSGGLAVGNRVNGGVRAGSIPPGEHRAFVLDERTGARRDLDRGDAVASQAIDVAPNGFVVGALALADGEVQPTTWDLANGERRTLATADYEAALPVAGNSARHVAGNAVQEGADVAVLWRPDGTLETLAPLNRFVRASTVADMNEDTVVVGELDVSPCCPRTAFVWSRSQNLRRLPSVSGSETPGGGGGEASATGVNRRGQIVGWVTDRPGGPRRPALWHADSLRLELLPDLGAGGELLRVADDGVAVGYSRPTPAAAPVPFCVNLGTRRPAPLAGPGVVVRAIDAAGRILGSEGGRVGTWDTQPCR